jgi:hypothetical protein
MTKARDLANGGFGLVLVKPSTVVNGTDNGKGTVSFSAASTVSLNGVFNSTYTNYLILINNTSQTNSTGGNFRLRVGGVDNSTASSYVMDSVQFTTGAPAGDFIPSTTTQFNYSQVGATGRRSAIIELFNPFDAVHTYYHCRGRSSLAQANSGSFITAGYHNQNTSYDGFTFYPDSGTFIGNVSVYGYNK